jgi:hypothetical protein
LTTGKSTQTSAAGDITPSFDLTGGVFGLALGYNWQVGMLLYGVDTDFRHFRVSLRAARLSNRAYWLSS